MSLYLVCHGGSTPDEWARRALRAQLPEQAAHFSAPEQEAVGTARLLTEQPVEVVEDLRRLERGTAGMDGLEATMIRGLLRPHVSPDDGWEPARRAAARVLNAVAGILQRLPDRDIVLVGHPLCWTVLAAALNGEDPDPEFWAALGTPDLIRLDDPASEPLQHSGPSAIQLQHRGAVGGADLQFRDVLDRPAE